MKPFASTCLSVLVLSGAVVLSGCTTPILVAGAAAGGASVAQDPRPTSNQLDDEGIELRVSSALTKDPELGKPENQHVSVTSYNGVVLLSGEARTAAIRDRIIALAKQPNGVRRIINAIHVGELSSLSTRAHDAWVTTKVKTHLLADKTVNGLRFKVVTDSGTVYLMGLVTRAESNLATQIVSNTEGVQRIVRIFEYVD